MHGKADKFIGRLVGVCWIGIFWGAVELLIFLKITLWWNKMKKLPNTFLPLDLALKYFAPLIEKFHTISSKNGTVYTLGCYLVVLKYSKWNRNVVFKKYFSDKYIFGAGHTPHNKTPYSNPYAILARHVRLLISIRWKITRDIAWM